MPFRTCREQPAHFTEAESLDILPALRNFGGSPTSPKPLPRELRLGGRMTMQQVSRTVTSLC
ncbi:MAG TPA: hypothetical protein VN688_22040 [Gemmataceae bacterium]|nr:hypothetical protein [Gemmataceae bacterium]